MAADLHLAMAPVKSLCRVYGLIKISRLGIGAKFELGDAGYDSRDKGFEFFHGRGLFQASLPA